MTRAPDGPFLLAVDVDGTLLGDREGEARMVEVALRHSTSLYLALVTGRTLPSVKVLVDGGRLPRPDYVCGSVGTELFAYDDPDNAVGQEYAARVPPEWDLETIYALGEGEGIRRQEFLAGQPRFQAGFDWDGKPDTLAAFYSRLADRERVHVFPSHGRYIDVLPASLGKGKAVEFLRQKLGLNPASVVVAGDSGNDRGMFDTEFKGIVPINALEELKAIARQPWHYQSPFPAARGVIDGLHHFGFIEAI